MEPHSLGKVRITKSVGKGTVSTAQQVILLPPPLATASPLLLLKAFFDHLHAFISTPMALYCVVW